MKRIIAAVAALGLLAGACGSGDEAAPNTTAEASDGSIEAPSDDVTDDAPTTDESDGSTAGTDGADSSDDGGDVADAGPIRSLDDIPEVCLTQMADFLREIEPIVSQIDWQTATLADFEEVSGEFEAISDEFDASSESLGCNDLDFVDQNESDLLTDFAKNQAPGTVGFLEFISSLSSIGSPGSDGSDSAPDGAFATCDEGIDFVRGLLDDYDSFADVPAAELVKFSQISSLYLTCTPEQLEFFDSDEFLAFLEG